MLSIINLDNMYSFSGNSWKQQHLATITTYTFKKTRTLLLHFKHVVVVFLTAAPILDPKRINADQRQKVYLRWTKTCSSNMQTL